MSNNELKIKVSADVKESQRQIEDFTDEIRELGKISKESAKNIENASVGTKSLGKEANVI